MIRALWLLILSPVLASAGQAQTAQTAPPATSALPRWVQATKDYQGGGYVPDRLFVYRAGPFEDAPTLRVQREVTEGSGKSGSTYKAIWALGASGPYNAGFEWTITGELHNKALASLGAQNVAVNGTIWREPNGLGPTAPSWGLNGNCVDLTKEQPPTAACIGAELDVGGAIGPDPNRQRVIAHGAGSGEAGSHIGYGYVVSGTPEVTIDRAFSTANVGAKFGIGLDLAGGVFSGPAIALAPRQWIALDADAAGKFTRFLGYDSSDGTLKYNTAGGSILRFTDDGAAIVGRVVEAIPHVPASSSSPCQRGERAWDERFEYRCVAPNRWKRAALSEW